MARKLIPILILLVAVAVPALPFAMGWQTERTYNDLVERVNADNPDVEVRIDDYERGWLSATVRYTVTITGQYHAAFRDITATDQALQLHGRDRIDHGPLARGEPAIARIDSEVRMAQALRALGQDDIADAPVLSARSVIGLDGEIRSRFHVPDHRFEVTTTGEDDADDSERFTIEWQGISGNAGIDGDLGRVLVVARQLGVHNDRGDRVMIRDFEAGDRSRRSSEGLWLGEAHLAADEVRFVVADPDQPVDFRMNRFTVDNRMDAEDGHVQVGSTFAFASALANGVELDDAELDLRLEHLPREPLARLQTLMTEMQRELAPGEEPDPEIDEQLRGEAASAFADILRGSPRLATDSLRVGTPEGEITGELNAAFDGERDFDLALPVTLLEPLSGQFELRVPRALVGEGLYASMRERLEADEIDEKTEQQLRQQADQTINLFVGMGLLKEEEGRLIIRLDKETGGPPLLNDQNIMQMIQALSGLMEQ